MPKSRLGFYFLSLDVGPIAPVAGLRPQVAVFLDCATDRLAAFVANSPNTFCVLRHYVDDGHYEQIADPLIAAAAWWNDIAPYANANFNAAQNGCLMTTNEPVLHSIAQAQWLSAFQSACNALGHANGFKVGAYSISTGNPIAVPPSTDEDMLWDYLHDGLETADYLLLHEYSGPTLTFEQGWRMLRYRRAYARLPQQCRRPLVISECGISIGNQEGWRLANLTDVQYVAELNGYDAELQKDNYVVGAAIFAYNDWGRKGSFGVGANKPLAAYIKSGGDALPQSVYVVDPSKSAPSVPPPAPLPVPAPAPDAGTLTVSWQADGIQEIHLNDYPTIGTGTVTTPITDDADITFHFHIVAKGKTP